MQTESSDVAFKLSRLRMKMLTKKGLGQIFQMNLVYEQLAKRLIMGNEFKRLAERARKDFRVVGKGAQYVLGGGGAWRFGQVVTLLLGGGLCAILLLC